jgi:D-alanyl-D-alanine carboxypeptidase
MVDTTAKELLIPGAVVLLRTPQGEFTVTHGTTLLGATSPPRADTHFRIASNTKTMMAAVIVLLAQEGKLSLDDPVSKYVPGVPNADKITITELLKMRSGLYTYDDDPEFWAILDRDPTKVGSPAEVLAIAFKHPPSSRPVRGFHYSNANYALLGLIAGRLEAAGQLFPGPFVRTVEPEGHPAPRHNLEHAPRSLLARLLVRRLLLQ